MKKIKIKQFSEYEDLFPQQKRSVLYRGVSQEHYELVPSLFRNPAFQTKKEFETMENNMMWLFKSHANPLLSRLPRYEIEWLAIAQHHGLATRLLDWTLSPLVAMFFAVNSLTKGEGAVYIYEADRFRKEEDINLPELYTVEAFFPSHSSNRITAQQGMFTVHPFEEKKLENDKITKVIFSEDLKHHFRVRMDKYGINNYSTFPDLDGLSKYVRDATGFGL